MITKSSEVLGWGGVNVEEGGGITALADARMRIRKSRSVEACETLPVDRGKTPNYRSSEG